MVPLALTLTATSPFVTVSVSTLVDRLGVGRPMMPTTSASTPTTTSPMTRIRLFVDFLATAVLLKFWVLEQGCASQL